MLMWRRAISGVVALLSTVTLLGAAEEIPLITAVRDGDARAVRSLLQRVDVNASEADGTTALHWAAHRGNEALVDLLLRAGARANVANELGVTPLALACTNGSGAVVERLLQAGADAGGAVPKEPVLLTCARAGSARAVRALLTRGADVNRAEPERGQTALMWAVAERHPEVVKVLLEYGAAVNTRSTVTREFVNMGDHHNSVECCCCPIADEVLRGGSTALLFAARSGDLESAQLLLGAGADVNATMADDNSALVVAMHSGHGKLAQLLLERGANPNAAGAGYTALHAAVLRGDLEIVKALLSKGADPNARLTKGNPTTRYGADYTLQAALVGATPFLLAAKFIEVDMMRVLAAAGADTRTPLKDGHTPLMAAIGIPRMGGTGTTSVNRREQDLASHLVTPDPGQRRTLEAVQMLLELGADVNAANDDGDTPVHLATVNGLDTVIRLLAKHGAKLDMRNKRGQTPLDLPVGWHWGSVRMGEEGTRNVADVLRSLGAK